MKITINPFDLRSIDKGIDAIEKYIEKLEKLETELPKALAEYGAVQAQAKFDTAAYDIMVDGSGSHPSITCYPLESENGWMVVADGAEVCFVEFGAGIYFNGEEAYLGERPPGIVGIGEYGKGHGNKPIWGIPKAAGGGLTHGTPASNALYFTARDMEERIVEEAKRILNDD